MNGVPMKPPATSSRMYRMAGLYLKVRPTFVFRPLLLARSRARIVS